MSEDELNTEIKISEYLKKNPVHRFKSYTIIIIVIVLILGLVFLTGAYGPDFFGIVIFLLIVSMPVIILFRYKLASILPKTISDNLLDIHNDDSKLKDLDVTVDMKFKTPKLVKEILVYTIIILLMIGSIMLLKKAQIEYIRQSSYIYILGSLVCLTLAGVTLLDIEDSTTDSSSSTTSTNLHAHKTTAT